jgi:hypothetical protein
VRDYILLLVMALIPLHSPQPSQLSPLPDYHQVRDYILFLVMALIPFILLGLLNFLLYQTITR